MRGVIRGAIQEGYKTMNGMNRVVTTLVLQPKEDSSIGRILVNSGKLVPEDVEQILRLQRDRGIRFGEASQELGLVTSADVEQALARQFDFPYLHPDQGRYPAELVAAYQPLGAQMETLRELRSELSARWFATGEKELVIAAVDPKGGASLLAANLAVAFSQLGEKTVLIDANMRCPQQHKIFNLRGKYGLSDILAGRVDVEVTANAEPFSNLSVLQSGTPPPNPHELLCRGAFNVLNEKLRAQFNIIIYDAPAFSAASDGYGLAAKAGGILFVVRKDATRIADVKRIRDKLARSGTQVIGFVFMDFT